MVYTIKNNKHIFTTDEHHTYHTLSKSELTLSRMKYMIQIGNAYTLVLTSLIIFLDKPLSNTEYEMS